MQARIDLRVLAEQCIEAFSEAAVEIENLDGPRNIVAQRLRRACKTISDALKAEAERREQQTT